MARQKMTIERIEKSSRLKEVKKEMTKFLKKNRYSDVDVIKKHISANASLLTLFEIASVMPEFDILNGDIVTFREPEYLVNVEYTLTGGNNATISFEGATYIDNNEAIGVHVYSGDFFKGKIVSQGASQCTLTITKVKSFTGNKTPNPKTVKGTGYIPFSIYV